MESPRPSGGPGPHPTANFHAALVVVAVMGRGSGVGSARPDPHLVALPVVLVDPTLPAGRGGWSSPRSRASTGCTACRSDPRCSRSGARRCRGAPRHGSRRRARRRWSPGRCRWPIPRPSQGRSRTRAAAGAEVDRQGRHPLLVDDLRRLGGDHRGELGAVRGHQLRIRGASVGEPHRADQRRGDARARSVAGRAPRRRRAARPGAARPATGGRSTRSSPGPARRLLGDPLSRADARRGRLTGGSRR